MKHIIIAAATLAFAASASAGVIVSDLFNNTGSTGAESNLLGVTWTQTGTYTNVTIEANLAASNGLSQVTGIAYLMNMIGSGATAANEVTAPDDFSVSGNPGLNGMTTLFSSLTLGPGTYYLLIDPVSTPIAVDWDLTTTPQRTLDTGVTQGADFVVSGTPAGFAPASTFTAASYPHIFEVTGTPSAGGAAPEPSTALLMLAGLAACGFAMRRRAA